LNIQKVIGMKKINGTAILFSILFMMTPFVLPAQERATVTVTIKNLRAISSDACGDMDFFAKIRIGGKLKTFPVREGDNITVNWQFTATTALDSVTTLIEIWDEDDAFCGGGDDAVIVNPTGSQRLSFSVSPADWGAKTTTVIGKRISGKEQAEITYTTTLVAL
jgi:hypothetical protein